MPITMKSARVNAGLTQEEASKKLGIAKTTLQAYEQYKTIPNAKVAANMAKLYKLSSDDIIFFKK